MKKVKKVELASLLRSAQRAFLFNITASMRLIAIDKSDNGVDMYVSSYQELSEDEIDCVYGAAGEITGDFVELDDINVIFSVCNDETIDISQFKGTIIYARCEYCY